MVVVVVVVEVVVGEEAHRLGKELDRFSYSGGDKLVVEEVLVEPVLLVVLVVPLVQLVQVLQDLLVVLVVL